MTISVYYHTYLDDNAMWSQLLMEKFKLIESSGLINNINQVKITAVTQNDARVRAFHDLCSLYKMPIEINFLQNQYRNDYEMIEDLRKIFDNVTKNPGENFTHKMMYEDCKTTDQNVLYLHAKGITSIINNLLAPGLVSKYKNRYDWRLFMYNVITDWKECVNALENGYDTAGIDYTTEPSPHYRGNFFWTKSEHVRKLPDPMTTEWWVELKREKNNAWLNKVCDRFGSELWLCSIPAKSFCSRVNQGNYIDNDI